MESLLLAALPPTLCQTFLKTTALFSVTDQVHLEAVTNFALPQMTLRIRRPNYYCQTLRSTHTLHSHNAGGRIPQGYQRYSRWAKVHGDCCRGIEKCHFQCCNMQPCARGYSSAILLLPSEPLFVRSVTAEKFEAAVKSIRKRGRR